MRLTVAQVNLLWRYFMFRLPTRDAVAVALLTLSGGWFNPRLTRDRGTYGPPPTARLRKAKTKKRGRGH